jgi:hypothetical protein
MHAKFYNPWKTPSRIKVIDTGEEWKNAAKSGHYQSAGALFRSEATSLEELEFRARSALKF